MTAATSLLFAVGALALVGHAAGAPPKGAAPIATLDAIGENLNSTVNEEFLGDMYNQLKVLGSCAMTCAKQLVQHQFDDFMASDCASCLARSVVGAVLPPSYALAFIQISTENLWDAICGKGAGVDMAKYPTGWVPAAGGKIWGGCDKATNYPGVGTTSYNTFAYHHQVGPTVPRRLYESDKPDGLFHGNELGTAFISTLFWQEVTPNTIFLGAPPKQHAAIRPFLDRIYGSSAKRNTPAFMEAVARKFLAHKTSLEYNDYVHFVHWVLWLMTFPGKKMPYTLDDFSAVQSQVPKQAAGLNLLPMSVQKALLPMTIHSKWHNFFNIYKPLVQEVYGDELDKLPADACGPSPCVDILTSAIRDSLFLAGGLSVPSILNTAMWTIYNGADFDAATFPSTQELMADNWSENQLFWESTRFFAPVFDFPVWAKPYPAVESASPTDRATADPWFTATSTHNPPPGNHIWMNVGLAQRDPNAWGADAHQFRKRSVKTYHDKSVGFMEGFVDDTFMNGAMNRVCPGRTASLQMGTAFLKVWKETGWKNWCVENTGDLDFTFKGSFVNAAKIKKQRTSNQKCPVEKKKDGWSWLG